MSRAIEYYEPTNANDRKWRNAEENVFARSHYQRGHGIGKFLGGLFRRALSYLARGAREIGKEALHAGVHIIDDVRNNTPLKEAIRNRFAESRSNLKRKAREKISSLMRGGGYKTDAKRPISQFPFNALAGHIVKSTSRRSKRRVSRKKTASKSSSRKSKKKSSKIKSGRVVKKKKKRTAKVTKRREKRRNVSDIFS